MVYFCLDGQSSYLKVLGGLYYAIFAYGQTSSGTTRAMTGVDLDADPAPPPPALRTARVSSQELYQQLSACKETPRRTSWGLEFNFKRSFIEIYNEDLLNLLADDRSVGGCRKVQIRKDKRGNIIRNGLRKEYP